MGTISMEDDIHRAVGRIEATLISNTGRLQRVEDRLEIIENVIMQSKGSWKAITIIASIGASIVASIIWLLEKLKY